MDEELSHDGCEGKLCRLSCRPEAFVGRLHVRVESRPDERRHVEGPADGGSPSSDEGVSGPSAGLPGDRGEACKAGGLCGVEDAEFGHFDEQGEGGHGRDAWNADEDCEPSGEIGVGVFLARIAASMAAIWRSICSRR